MRDSLSLIILSWARLFEGGGVAINRGTAIIRGNSVTLLEYGLLGVK